MLIVLLVHCHSDVAQGGKAKDVANSVSSSSAVVKPDSTVPDSTVPDSTKNASKSNAQGSADKATARRSATPPERNVVATDGRVGASPQSSREVVAAEAGDSGVAPRGNSSASTAFSAAEKQHVPERAAAAEEGGKKAATTPAVPAAAAAAAPEGKKVN